MKRKRKKMFKTGWGIGYLYSSRVGNRFKLGAGAGHFSSRDPSDSQFCNLVDISWVFL